MPRLGSLPWRKDPVILARLVLVERGHLRGATNYAIADELGVDEKTIRNDLDRIREMWNDRVGGEIASLKAQTVAELDDVRHRAIAAAEFDEEAERAVLYGETTADRKIRYDDKGSVTFRGNKSGALNTARQASMDKAKVLGIIVERQAHEGEMMVRQYVGVDPDKV